MNPLSRFLLGLMVLTVGAASALPVYRTWRLPTEQGEPDLSLTELENGNVRFALEYTGEYPGTVDLTKREAAEIGRALLEAAGETEKKDFAAIAQQVADEMACARTKDGSQHCCVGGGMK